jgi:hypothetical protein
VNLTRLAMNRLGKYYGRMLKNQLEGLKTLSQSRNSNPLFMPRLRLSPCAFLRWRYILSNNDIS